MESPTPSAVTCRQKIVESSSNFSSRASSQSRLSSSSSSHQCIKKSRQKKKFTHTFQVKTFTQQPPKFAGKNTLFGRFRASFFLLHFYYPKYFHVVTNNTNLKSFSFYSDRRNSSRNFVISNFINGVFRFLNFHKNFSDKERQKYFSIVRRHMHDQFRAICRRLSNPEKLQNNNQTRTYFRFSVGRQTYYFGFHVPCASPSCCAPPTFVSKQGSHCWIHWKDRCQALTPDPIYRPPAMDNRPKTIISRRLGVSYTKEIAFSERLNKYFVVYKNFKRLSTKNKKQSVRFDRLTQSTSSNDAAKLITADKSSVSVPCHHFHHNTYKPIRISLTDYVDDFFRSFPLPTNHGSRVSSTY